MEGYKYDQVVIDNSFHIYESGQAEPTVGSEVGSSTSKFCCPYEMETIKARIVAHPHYSSLLQAYLDCSQVGAPPDVVARLAAARREFEAAIRLQPTSGSRDPELDHFMEAYYDMLVRYRGELCRPIQEATDFMRRIESQLSLLVNGSAAGGRIFDDSEDKYIEDDGSSEDEDTSNRRDDQTFDLCVEDDDLRNQLLRKYGGCMSSLRQELSKKKKKGKLPKEAREKLFSWWESHQRWPYPSESEKLALTETTGLDPKQINNWFINQRKRHWRPSQDVQLVVVDGHEAQAQGGVLYMADHIHGPFNLRP